MKKLFFAPAVVLLLTIEPALTNDLLPGYVVTNDQDTLRGYLMYEIDADLASSVTFVEDQGTTTSFSTSDLLGFGFNSGRTFERKRVPGASADASWVFAKKYVSGKINMWIWRKKGHPGIVLENRASDRTTFLSGPDPTAIASIDGSKYSTDHVKYTSLIQYVLDDPLHAPSNTKIRYSEKSIAKHIQNYNARFLDAYPVSENKDRMAWNVDVTLGMVPWVIGKVPHMRAAVYAALTNLDKTRRWSFIAGTSYLRASRNKNIDKAIDDGDVITQVQSISIIPVGVRYQNTGHRVQFYAYGGIGVRLGFDRIGEMHQGVEVDTYTDTYLVPITMNVGAGLRIKAGSGHILAEITPSMSGGLFLNVGYSF
jgi:hypothetical protein